MLCIALSANLNCNNIGGDDIDMILLNPTSSNMHNNKDDHDNHKHDHGRDHKNHFKHCKDYKYSHYHYHDHHNKILVIKNITIYK